MIKYVIAGFLSLIIGFIFGVEFVEEEKALDPKVHVPGEYKVKRSFMESFGLARVSRSSHVTWEKSHLKQIGTTLAIYFTDESSLNYPEDPNEFDLDISLFYPRHLRGKYIGLPEGWKMPNTWEALNQSNSPFVFLRKPDDVYEGSSTIPICITRYGYQAGKDFNQLVYEDGHVSTLPFEEAVKHWKEAKVWNGD